jgi:hypothetical protein
MKQLPFFARPIGQHRGFFALLLIMIISMWGGKS